MKKIGFIDYFIDEWHANNYPDFIAKTALKDEFCVHMAWEEITPPGKRSLKEWCRDLSVQSASSIEELVEACDCLLVLAPSNPEVHERLAEIPLKSGKPLYIDKPFAPDPATAARIIKLAEKHGTPLMSSSALRFGSEIQGFLKEHSGMKAETVFVSGGGSSFQEYSIHQIEMAVMLMGQGAKYLTQLGSANSDILLVEYLDGRQAFFNRYEPQGFGIRVQYERRKNFIADNMGDFFPRFILAMLEFFKTGQSPVPKEETLEIVRIMEAGIKALKSPGVRMTI